MKYDSYKHQVSISLRESDYKHTMNLSTVLPTKINNAKMICLLKYYIILYYVILFMTDLLC